MTTLFQIQDAGLRLLDYGILGIMLVIVGFFAYKMWQKINEDQNIWRNEAIESRKDQTKLMEKQNELNQALLNIREKDVEQHKNQFHDLKKMVEKLPDEISDKLKINLDCQQSN